MSFFPKQQIFIAFLSMSVLPLSGQVDASLTSSLDSMFSRVFNVNEPGGAVLIARNDQIIYENGFGIADIHTKEAITPKTLFNLGSISKTVVAYGILQLAAEKKLSLNDNLFKYFPDFKDLSIAKRVMLYHLLTHTSGLPDSRKIDDEREFYLTAKDEENFAPLKQAERLEFVPGSRYKYSNPAFNGLALIIEKVTAQKWQDYIAKKIFEPAGMKTSTITDGPHPENGVAHGYVMNAKDEFEELDYGEEPTFAASGNGGGWSSVEELWLYEKAIQKNLFLSPEWVKKSRTIYALPGWKDAMPSRLGLSWFLTKENGRDIVGHTGSQGGFISDYVWLPQEKVFYVLLCNVPKSIKEIRAQLFEVFDHHKFLQSNKSVR